MQLLIRSHHSAGDQNPTPKNSLPQQTCKNQKHQKSSPNITEIQKFEEIGIEIR